jgi:hypothetical protein
MLLLTLLATLSMQAPAAPASPPGLKATIKISLVKLEAPAVRDAEKPSPLGNFGPLLTQILTPEGPVDIQYTIVGGDTRADIRGRLATLPRGTFVLQRVGDDTIRVVDPAAKTWYALPASQNLGVLLGTPDVTIEPANETATIAGQHAQRFRFRETLQVPVAEGVSLPPGFPKEVDLAGDLWSTDAYAGANYAAVFKTLQAFAAIPGVEALTAGGRFPLRIALRSSIMPGYEIRSEVTAIGPASADPSFFTVPSDYVKIQPPTGGG